MTTGNGGDAPGQNDGKTWHTEKILMVILLILFVLLLVVYFHYYRETGTHSPYQTIKHTIKTVDYSTNLIVTLKNANNKSYNPIRKSGDDNNKLYVEFGPLPPGQYTLKVKKKKAPNETGHGVADKKGPSFSFYLCLTLPA
jgi:uncharacterized protein YxeA